MSNKSSQANVAAQADEPYAINMPAQLDMNKYSPELQDFLRHVEAALIDAGQRARKLAEQTGTTLVVVERKK